MVLKYDINLLFRFFMNVHDSCSCFNLMQDQTKILFVSRFFYLQWHPLNQEILRLISGLLIADHHRYLKKKINDDCENLCSAGIWI